MRTLTGEQFLGAVTVDDGQHRPLVAPAAGRMRAGRAVSAVIWMRLGVPTASAASTAAPASSACTCTE